MADFMSVFEKQLALGVDEYVLKFNAANDSINQKFFAEPFLSCFCRDCIGRGLDINMGGAIYPSVHGAGLMGVGTLSDSLAPPMLMSSPRPMQSRQKQDKNGWV